MSILGNVQRVLQLFADGTDDLSFTEAAARLDLPRSSASHLLNQMARYGLLDRLVAHCQPLVRADSRREGFLIVARDYQSAFALRR